jgi:hypothetical protein
MNKACLCFCHGLKNPIDLVLFLFVTPPTLDTHSPMTLFCSHFHFGLNRKGHIFYYHGVNKIHIELVKGDAKLWKELSLVCITFYYLPTTLILFNPIHELTSNNESTLDVVQNSKMLKWV